ncbi:choice-of-anchor Q domain-containing protein, partial [Thermodesulfobacteriota bacterium]
MQRSINLFLVSFICVSLFSTQANAYKCVNNSSDFQLALDNVSADNEIRIETGTYIIPANSAGHFNVTADHSLTISGGWKTGCSSQAPDPKLTILQGGTKQDGPGGVLYVRIQDNSSAAIVDISNLTIENGSSNNSGGGCYFEHNLSAPGTAKAATFKISNFIAQANTAYTFGSGLAIYDWGTDGLSVNIKDCLVQNNSVFLNSSGGPAGIYIDNDNGDIEVSISECQIINNDAELDGGGLYIDSGSGNATLVNNVIADNTVLYDNGGGIIIYNDNDDNVFITRHTTLTNNTITENLNLGTSGDYLNGSELYVLFDSNNSSSTLNLFNNIIYNTKAGTDLSDDIYISNPNSNNVTIKYNNLNDSRFHIEDSTNLVKDATNLDNSDPLFLNPGDYHLTASSPAIDAGGDSDPLIPVVVPSVDLEGVARPQGSNVDMGAYEYQATTTTSTLTVEDVTETEGTGLIFTVSLDNEVKAGNFTVDVNLADITATGGADPLVTPEDYANTKQTLDFVGIAGETQEFTVSTLDDAVFESSTETFSVNLNSSNTNIDDSDTATGTIIDNETTSLTVEDVTETEGTDLSFIVTLNNALPAGAFTVEVNFEDVSATGGAAPLETPEDYDNDTQILDFVGTAGESQQFTVATLDDTLLEADIETFTVNLTSSNAAIDDSDTATGMINDNEAKESETTGG